MKARKIQEAFKRGQGPLKTMNVGKWADMKHLGDAPSAEIGKSYSDVVSELLDRVQEMQYYLHITTEDVNEPQRWSLSKDLKLIQKNYMEAVMRNLDEVEERLNTLDDNMKKVQLDWFSDDHPIKYIRD